SDGGQTSFSYNGDTLPLTITKTQLANPDPSIISSTVLDGLGRIKQMRLDFDPEGIDYTDTTYDALGRVQSVSNPYRATSDPTYGITSYGYDALGRRTTVTRQDGNTVQTNYANFPTVVTTDETGRQRQSTTDALGRLTQVVEPNPATGSLTSGSYPTYYSYDTLGNLTNVNQVGDGSGPARQRGFAYDSLSRLLSATNPESGRICYGTVSGTTCNTNGYDADGNLLYKTDARGVGTSFSYDALHRLTFKGYSDGTLPAYFTFDQYS